VKSTGAEPAVAAAVATAGSRDEGLERPAGSGRSACSTYTPATAGCQLQPGLLPGQRRSFDRTNISTATKLQALTGAAATASDGKLLLRFVQTAGLRMHVRRWSYGDDAVGRGRHLLPALPQAGRVFLAAGKTYDVTIQPAQTTGSYTAATYACTTAS